MEAYVIHTDNDGAETIACNGHTIQFGHGGGGDGFCYAHQSFSCVDNLTDEEKRAFYNAKHPREGAPTNSAPSRNEVERLKWQWEQDPCWDLEMTEGFEMFETELYAHRIATEKRWRAENNFDVMQRAAQPECSTKIAEVVIGLESSLRRMQDEINGLKGK